MKVSYCQVAMLVVVLIASQVQGFDLGNLQKQGAKFAGQVQQGATQAAQVTQENLGATVGTLTAAIAAGQQIANLVASVESSVNTSTTAVKALVAQGASLKGSSPEGIVSGSFKMISASTDIPLVLLPIVEQLNQVLSIVANQLMPALNGFSGAQGKIPDISTKINEITKKLEGISGEISLWNSKVKGLVQTLGGHADAITAEVQGAVKDVQGALK